MCDMEKYNNSTYRELITTIVNDAFYVDGLSYDAKEGQIRKYTEIIIRRLLHVTKDRQLTLGDNNIIKELKSQGYTEPLFWKGLGKITKIGNERTHTRNIQVATADEYEKIFQGLIELYGYLFYKYFKKYTFGTNPSVITAFSILPPRIRFVTLDELYKDNSQNTIVAEKLLLAIIKAYSFGNAEKWLQSQKSIFEKIQIDVPEDYRKQLIALIGSELAYEYLNKSLYDHLYEILNSMKNSNYKPLYTTFEEAVEYYKQNGKVDGNTEDIIEFNDLMEFVYIGRHNQ